MPLFLVTGMEPFPKVLVAKNSIEAVKTSSIEKLKLPPAEYKLILKKNGALIDEDELLGALQPESELIILEASEEWQESTEARMSPPAFIPVTPTIALGTHTPSRRPRSTPRSRPSELSVPWASFESVQGELESGSPLQPRSFRIIVHALANHLVAKKDYTRTSCSTLAKEVFGKHSDAFAIKDADGVMLSTGFNSFLASLYERVNLLKPDDLKKKRGAKRQLMEDEDDNLSSWNHQVNPQYDSYGCAAWKPPLPQGETREEQERKRARALVEETPGVLLQIMEKTYWLQRTDLNCRKGDLCEVLTLWPALKKTEYFLQHSSTLLAKDCSALWYDALHTQGGNLFKYFDDYCRTTKSSNHNKEQINKMKDLSEKAETAEQQLKSKQPIITSMFMMILFYLYEKIDSIFHLMDADAPDADVPKSDRPLLLIKGRSMFDEGAHFFIVCEGNVILQPSSLNEAVMLHFLSFYVFNYNYPEDGRKYMEFIQRQFFKINPMDGHKRGPKSSRTNILDPHVKKLMTHYSNFKVRLARLLA